MNNKNNSKFERKLKSILKYGVFITSLYFIGNGCYNRIKKINAYDIEGIVIEESFSRGLVKVPEYTHENLIGESYSNETMTIESNYLITMKVTKSEVQVPDTIIIDVNDRRQGVTKEGLEKLLKKGSKIAIQSKCRVNNKSYLINKKTYEIKVIKP